MEVFADFFTLKRNTKIEKQFRFYLTYQEQFDLYAMKFKVNERMTVKIHMHGGVGMQVWKLTASNDTSKF